MKSFSGRFRIIFVIISNLFLGCGVGAGSDEQLAILLSGSRTKFRPIGQGTYLNDITNSEIRMVIRDSKTLGIFISSVKYPCLEEVDFNKELVVFIHQGLAVREFIGPVEIVSVTTEQGIVNVRSVKWLEFEGINFTYKDTAQYPWCAIAIDRVESPINIHAAQPYRLSQREKNRAWPPREADLRGGCQHRSIQE